MPPTATELTDLFWRAFYTFAQAAIGVLIASSALDWDVSAIEGATAAGIAAAGSVALNFAGYQLRKSSPFDER